ncbi:MAG: LCP family protein [Firmicutes bacterium]|nr:LCP family protein [Bacillota bacterium]
MLQKILIIVLALLVIGSAVIAGSTLLYVDSKIGKMNMPSVKIEAEDLSCVDVDGYINIMLIGIDARDIKSTEDARGDALIIASIEEETGKVYLTSIYRDTYLKMGGYDLYDKITHSFTYGGPKEVIKTVNQAMDLDIKHYVMFNFKAVADVVDEMGGLELNVEEYEISQLNTYSDETADIIGRDAYPQVTEPGKQLLAGTQVVSYGRIRKGVGDDFKRTERMRTVISALLAEAKKMNVSKLNQLIDVAVPQIETNLKTSDVLGLAMNLSKYRIAGSDGFPYHLTTGYLNEVSYVFPSDLEGDVREFHKKVFAREEYEPTQLVIAMSDRIWSDVNGGASQQTAVDLDTYYSDPAGQEDLLNPDYDVTYDLPEPEPEPDDTDIPDAEEIQNPEEGQEFAEGEEPAEVTDPENPEEETEAEASEEPEEPTEPEAGEEPEETEDPEGTETPAESEEPEPSGEPEEPAEPETPEESEDPGELETPDEPQDTEEPEGTAEPEIPQGPPPEEGGDTDTFDGVLEELGTEESAGEGGGEEAPGDAG